MNAETIADLVLKVNYKRHHIPTLIKLSKISNIRQQVTRIPSRLASAGRAASSLSTITPYFCIAEL